MENLGTFPFGELVKRLVQTDRRAKRVFVLGVYASAVHARWIGPDEKTCVRALAVASEPAIFWRGDGAQHVIEDIEVPPEMGRLVEPHQGYNGPSGVTLDECFLKPLRLSRDEAWLCDLVPYSCSNPAQQQAIARAYTDLAIQHGLSPATVPPVPSKLADETRRNEILDELQASQATTLILFGDEPIKWFLAKVSNQNKTRLTDFGTTPADYGRLHSMRFGEREWDVLPLVHPRQAARLGRSSSMWYDLHNHWVRQTAGTLTLRG